MDDPKGRMFSPKAREDEIRRTIVGVRPPEGAGALPPIPRGIEVLIKKASVDSGFRDLLLADREAAAREIGLDLAPSERAVLAAVPARELEAFVDRVRVPEEHRRVFLGRAAAAMLALVAGGAMLASCVKGSRPDAAPPPSDATLGIRPDLPENKEENDEETPPPSPPPPPPPYDPEVTRGMRADFPPRRVPSEG
ncbi:MAG: hypothetical protein JXP34_22445 [Planctomycetes bacterium]|nr:hypothetical protein [Planctomycetota bacterium]